jgi:hypothetical protein
MKYTQYLIISLIITFSIPASAEYKFANNWDKEDTAYQATFLAITTVDWMQTRWMVKHDWQWDGEYYHELNPVLGDYPSLETVDTYIPLAMVAHTLVAMAIPNKTYRRIWQCLWIGVEGGAVYHNYSTGVKLEF